MGHTQPLCMSILFYLDGSESQDPLSTYPAVDYTVRFWYNRGKNRVLYEERYQNLLFENGAEGQYLEVAAPEPPRAV